MIRFNVLASGSKGNATVIEGGGFRILLDCGLSVRDLALRLASCDLRLSDIDAVVVTHLHSDHVRGLPALLQKIPVDVFLRKRMHDIGFRANWRKIQPLSEFETGPFRIMPLPLPHDDGGSMGYIFSFDDIRLVYATDLGFPTRELSVALRSANSVIIESNHDLKMLAECSYPDFIKNRIRSEDGHLSNCQCAELLQTSLSKDCQHIILAHLSEKANHPAQAVAQMRQSISRPVTVASQHIPTGWLYVDPGTGMLSVNQ